MDWALADRLNRSASRWMNACSWRLHESGAWVSAAFTGMENLDPQGVRNVSFPLPDSQEKRSEVVFGAKLEYMRATSRFDIVWPWKQDEASISCVMARCKAAAKR